MAQRMNDVKPKRGDLIEIDRGAFQHWAIYVGDGYVIHLITLNAVSASDSGKAGFSSTMSDTNNRGIVEKERLLDVVRTNRYQVNNKLDKTYKPRSVSDILKDAESRVGQEPPYHVILYNCEHFVTELRYGKPESRQVAGVMETLLVLLEIVINALWNFLVG